MYERGAAQVGLPVLGALLGVPALVLLIANGAPFVDLLVVAGLLVSLAAARATLAVHVDLPDAPAPRRPVLFFNPRSGAARRSASRSPTRPARVGSSRSS